jgi:hypothetical protein
MTDEPKPFEGEADRLMRKHREEFDANEKALRKQRTQTPEEQLAAEAGTDLIYNAAGKAFAQIRDPSIGVQYAASPDGRSHWQEPKTLTAGKSNRQRVLGKNNEALPGQKSNSDWLWDT